MHTQTKDGHAQTLETRMESPLNPVEFPWSLNNKTGIYLHGKSMEYCTWNSTKSLVENFACSFPHGNPMCYETGTADRLQVDGGIWPVWVEGFSELFW